MPYIKEEDRRRLDAIIAQFPSMEEPEVDYVITRLAIITLKRLKPRFVSANRIWGVMTGAAQEFYRRLLGPYENKKATDNGDVYADLLVHFNMPEEIFSEEG
jgi:hypothetical protein